MDNAQRHCAGTSVIKLDASGFYYILAHLYLDAQKNMESNFRPKNFDIITSTNKLCETVNNKMFARASSSPA